MNKTVCILSVATAVSCAGLPLCADDLDDLDDFGDFGEAVAEQGGGEAVGGEEAVDAAEAADEDGQSPAADASKQPARIFDTLPLCKETEGVVEVFRPGAREWEPAVLGRFYALGTAYRTVGADSRAVIKLGKSVSVAVGGDSSFRTCAQALSVQSRTVALDGGTVTVSLPNNMPEGRFIVSAPGFSAVNQRGAARYTYRRTGDGDDVVIRCVTGDLSVEGRHFRIMSMKVATEVRIRTSQDLMFTGLYGQRGDMMVRLDQGRVFVKDYDTGAVHEEDKTLDWKLSPLTAVRIYRALPRIGSKLSVSVMTFDAAGGLRNRCAFTEQTASVNSGELGFITKKDREDIERKISEATESVDVDVEPEPEAADDAGADAGSGAEPGGDDGFGDDFL